MNNLFKEAKSSSAFLKVGIHGFQGAGKTYTAMELAIGITKQANGKSIAFFDTETGSDWHIKRAKASGLTMYQHKGRAFKDLLDYIKGCEEQEISALVIDSITHVWREFTHSYLTKKGRTYFTMPDWQYLKTEWQKFSDLFVNSKVHIVMCGRSGHEYETSENEDTGRKEMTRSGTKMKVEGETGFEPSLLLEMESIKENGKSFNRCHVLKDRNPDEKSSLNGKIIDNPTYASFASHIAELCIGGEHLGVDLSRTSEDLFKNDTSGADRRAKDIAVETLAEALTLLNLEGRSAETTKKRTEVLKEIFKTSSKTAIESLPTEVLIAGIERLKKDFSGKFVKNYADDIKSGHVAAN